MFRRHPLYQQDGGTTTGGGPEGGTTPPAAGTTPPAGTGAADDDKRFTQADLDRLIAVRLTQEKDRETKRTADATRKAAEKAATDNGEWEKVASARQAEVAERDARIAALEAEIAGERVATIRAKVAGKYKLPDQLAGRLQGATEAELEADAKALAKLLVVSPPANTGLGNNGNTGGATPDAFRAGLKQTGRYG